MPVQVYKAIRGGVTVVAVKVMGETAAEQRQADRVMQQQELFEREIHILKSCRDRNVVQFLGACLQVSLAGRSATPANCSPGTSSCC